jgi:cysteine desulfurase
MMVNNETGVIQPVAEIAKMAKDADILFHCDAVQSYGRIPFTREAIGADFITLSAHKIGGSSGVGAIVIAPNAPLPKLVEGGGQEKRMRGGTENVSGIAGFGAAAAEAINTLNHYQSLAQSRARIESELMKCSKVKINGQNAQRVANTTSCVIDGISGDVLLMNLDIEGIGVSAGAACSSGSMKFSHVLQAMGIEGKADRSAMRISLGYTTTEDEVDHFIAVWNNLRARLLKD